MKSSPTTNFEQCDKLTWAIFYIPCCAQFFLFRFNIYLKNNSNKKTYKTTYFDNNINRFVNYMRQRPYKKYYYYQTIKKISFGENLYTPEEKIKFIKEYFDNNQLSKKYDISINSPVSFINVNLIEK